MAYSILGDVHTHTVASRHAYSTVLEDMAAAQAAGLEVLGITDHFSSMLYPEQHLRNFQNFLNMRSWPRELGGVSVLHGCEVDIVGLDGALFGKGIKVDAAITGKRFERVTTLYNRVARACDYMIASVHNADFAEGASVAQITDMYVAALEEPKVFILGHSGRAGLPYDLDTVLTCAKEHGKLIELNEHSLDSADGERHRGVCREIAMRCAELGVGVAVSSDAHISTAIGRFPSMEQMLEEIRFPEELIVNRGRESFFAQLEAAGLGAA